MPERFVGRTLGKYRIDALLGSGGFAWVYRALDPDLDVPVALKVLKPQYAGDPAFEERFRREASTAAKLRHPNIVTIYAVGKEDDAVFFAMDHLPQGLANRLQVMPALPGPMLVRLGLDVAAALGFAHRQGVVHRDIKPDNILFDDHGNAIVADFGIARALTGNSADAATQMVVGTPHYFAPEQARGRSLDGRADLYALGITLYRAATGVLPFPGDDWYDVARAQVEQEPPDVRSHGTPVSPELAAVIHRALEKEPDDRFQTAEEMAEALGAVPERGEPSTMRTMAMPALDRIWTSTGITARRRRLRRRVLWAGGSAGVVAVAAAALLAGHRPPPPAPAPPTTAVGDEPTPMLMPVVVAAIPLPDTTPTPVVTTGTLRLRGPDDARLSLDGRPVGTGSWASAAVAPGRHRIAAELPTIADCPTATDSRTVTILAGESRTVSLAPRPCGLLAMYIRAGFGDRPAAIKPEQSGRYLLSADGTTVTEGALPLSAPLTLPVGRYELVIQMPRCNSFSSRMAGHPVEVKAGSTPDTVKVVLDCR